VPGRITPIETGPAWPKWSANRTVITLRL